MDFIFRNEAEFEEQRGAFMEEGMVLSRHPGSPSADLSLAENDKAAGIRCFLTKTGIAKEDTAAFGDGWNDIAMMKAQSVSALRWATLTMRSSVPPIM